MAFPALSAVARLGAHTYTLPESQALYVFSDTANPADDFVADHEGVHGNAPVVLLLVNVAMANAAGQDLDFDLVVAL